MSNTIRLEKDDNFWEIEFKGSTAIRSWGKIGGKIQTEKKTWLTGKNEGKTNATTPEEQCRRDMVSKALKQITNNYTVVKGQHIINEYSTGLATETHFSVPEPMCAHPRDKHEKKIVEAPYLMVQAKKDGNRCICDLETGKLYSRKRKEITAIPGLGAEIQNAFSSLRNSFAIATVMAYDKLAKMGYPLSDEWKMECARIVGRQPLRFIDGELFDEHLTFNEIQSIIRSKEPVGNHAQIKLNVFDFISDLPSQVRAIILNNEQPSAHRISFRVSVLDTFFINKVDGSFESMLTEFHQRFVVEGDEGLMIRFPFASYINKRTDRLLKMKEFDDAEFYVVGWEHEKNDPNSMGAAICLLNKEDLDRGKIAINGDANHKYDESQVFNAVPKMSQRDKDIIWAQRRTLLGKLATVRFQGYDAKSGKPRFGRIIGFGADRQDDEE